MSTTNTTSPATSPPPPSTQPIEIHEHDMTWWDKLVFPQVVLETHEHQYAQRQKDRLEEMSRTRLYVQNQILFKKLTGSKSSLHVPTTIDPHDNDLPYQFQTRQEPGSPIDHHVAIHELGDDANDAALQNALAVFDEDRVKAQQDVQTQQHIILSQGKRYHCNLEHARRQFISRIIAEFVGTMMLVFAHSGMKLETNDRFSWLDSTGHALFDGLVLLFLINSLGGISGAHFNPTVTMAFTLAGDFPWVWVIPYYIAQYAGACLAGGFLYAAWTDAAYLGTSSVYKAWSETGGLLWEIMLTYFLLFTILMTASKGHNFGPHSALSVCCTIAFDVAIGGKASSASMNPFRSLGPYTINSSERPHSIWVFVVGPYIGALIAFLTTRLLIGKKPSDGDKMAAYGFGKVCT